MVVVAVRSLIVEPSERFPDLDGAVEPGDAEAPAQTLGGAEQGEIPSAFAGEPRCSEQDTETTVVERQHPVEVDDHGDARVVGDGLTEPVVQHRDRAEVDRAVERDDRCGSDQIVTRDEIHVGQRRASLVRPLPPRATVRGPW